MSAYNYLALNAKGRRLKGVLEADSERHARSLLRERGLKPIQLGQAAGEKTASADAPGQRGLRAVWFEAKIKPGMLALLTRQMAILLQAGLPLDEALQTVSRQLRKARHAAMLLRVRARITEGHTLAYGLSEHPRTFNAMYRAMVNAGERAGLLGAVMERLAEYTETRQKTQQDLQGAMIYPIVLVAIAVSVVAALMTYLVPELVRIFRDAGSDLPMLTRVVIFISDYLTEHGLTTLAAIAGAVALYHLSMRNKAQRRMMHRIALKLPGIGRMTRTVDCARFTSTLSILVGAGVPLLQALQIAGQVMNNEILREASENIATRVREGSSMHRAMEMSGQFPPLVVYMVASGEASGRLEEMLGRTATNLERELQMTLKNVMNLLEPLMVVSMGGMVLLIVLAVLLPIFNLNQLVN